MMRNELIGLPRQRATRPPRVFTTWPMGAAFLFYLIGAPHGEAQAEGIISWKLKAGDVLKYTTEQKILINVKVMGRDRKQTRSQTIHYTWTVKDVAGDGLAEIVQHIDRLGMRVEAPPYMPFEFDSNTPNAEVPEPFEAEARQLKATIGAEFQFKMRPSGEIADIQIGQATLKKLRDALPQGEQGEAAAFSEQGLKDMLMQSSPPPFPQTPVEPGKTWSSKPAKLTLPQGSLVLDKVFTFQGPDPKDPKLLLIGMESRVALEPGENVTTKIRSQEGKGSLVFDSEAGRIASSRGTQRTELLISSMGQEIDQTTEMTSTMTLVP
jgi:hypothetical protein